MEKGKRHRIDLEVGQVLYNNYYKYGYVITEILPDRMVDNRVHEFIKIKFLDSGYETEVDITKYGLYRFEDPYYKKYFGVASRGVTPKLKYVGIEWRRWYGMISRCYNKDDNGYQYYGGVGVTVCNRWLCFEYYLNDLPSLPGYENFKANPSKYYIDKDVLQAGVPENQKVYSPQTCMFLEKNINSKLGALNNSGKNTYTGVTTRNNGSTFIALVYHNDRCYRLGCFNNEIAAANMYNHINIALGMTIGLNDVPFMSIEECLKYRTSTSMIELPNNLYIPEIDAYNNSDITHYYGVRHVNGHYESYYRSNNGKDRYIGTFDDEIPF